MHFLYLWECSIKKLFKCYVFMKYKCSSRCMFELECVYIILQGDILVITVFTRMV